jgi:hypothetical protein
LGTSSLLSKSVNRILNIPQRYNLSSNGGYATLEEIDGINKKILLFLKFQIAPTDLPYINSSDYPTISGEGLGDFKSYDRTMRAIN